MSAPERRVLILGAGGHARVIAGLLAQTSWEVVGVLDRDVGALGESVSGHRIIGVLDDLDQHFSRGIRHVALAIGDNAMRATWFDRARATGFEVISLRHPTACIESNATLAGGVIVCIGAVIGAEASIGHNAIINSGSVIDHECVIGNHAHIGPGARLAGRVRVGELTFVGLGSCVRQQITIGSSTLIGAGSVVVADIPDGVTAFGSPARVRQPA